MTVLKSLAKIHARYRIFELSQLFSEVNIIDRILPITELFYLRNFYIGYRKAYQENFIQAGPSSEPRSTDLPFIGEMVCEKRKAKYFFVFQGTLQKTDRLSATVLSCLWGINSPAIDLFQAFWPSTYHRIVRMFGMNSNIAKQAYVVDANRTKKIKTNRDLLYEEIELLNPNLILLIGKSALQSINQEDKCKNPNRYFYVPYPSTTRSKIDHEQDCKIYQQVRDKINEIV